MDFGDHRYDGAGANPVISCGPGGSWFGDVHGHGKRGWYVFILCMIGVIVLSGNGLIHAGKGGNESVAEGGKFEKATFAGGCFWCMEPPFDKLKGVVSTTVGYAGGREVNPTYEEVASGETGHAEAIQVVYDPSIVSYEALLDVFWKNVDPTQVNGQFVDKGAQYRTAVFYHNEEQKRLALASKESLEKSGIYQDKIVTEIVPVTAFYKAEEYHQDYYKKNSLRYKWYRFGSGRDRFLEKVWGEK
jgi:peptide-methionine (S)-S-oxide reductase